MKEKQIIKRIHQGEDSQTQFKENFTNSEQVAAEMAAFSNSKGGFILIGVSDEGEITGLSKEDIQRLNQLISNTATENIKPPITPLTEIIRIENKKILVIEVKQGINKPYCTNKNIFYTKVGADKRKISREELLRLFQESGHLSADVMLIYDSTIDDLNLDKFKKFGHPVIVKSHPVVPLTRRTVRIGLILGQRYLIESTITGLPYSIQLPYRLIFIPKPAMIFSQRVLAPHIHIEKRFICKIP